MGLITVASWREIPNWRSGGAAPIATASLTRGRGILLCPPAGSRIAIYGDSHVVGTGGARGVVPFGNVLEYALPAKAKVDLHGQGGDTALMGERRWRGTQPAPSLVLLAYGTNDAAPRGWIGRKDHVPLVEYTASLQRQIDRWQTEGAQVALIVPPPPGSAAMLERIEPYRAAAAALGKRNGLAVLDPADAFAKCASEPALLDRDALHMSAAGHRCLGRWIAYTLCPSQL
jgi:lysophospholipase L1-like esterase